MPAAAPSLTYFVLNRAHLIILLANGASKKPSFTMSNLNYNPDDVATLIEQARAAIATPDKFRLNMLQMAIDVAETNANYCNVAEAIKASGLSKFGINKALREQRLQGRRDGRDWLVSRADLTRFMEQRNERTPKRTRAQIVAQVIGETGNNQS